MVCQRQGIWLTLECAASSRLSTFRRSGGGLAIGEGNGYWDAFLSEGGVLGIKRKIAWVRSLRTWVGLKGIHIKAVNWVF